MAYRRVPTAKYEQWRAMQNREACNDAERQIERRAREKGWGICVYAVYIYGEKGCALIPKGEFYHRPGNVFSCEACKYVTELLS